MSCTGKRDLIARYIMDELSASSRIKLEEHIRDCPSCRAEYLFAENVEDALLNQQLVPSPAGLEEGIMEAVDSLEKKSLESRIVDIVRNRKRLTFRRDLLPVFAYSAAAVITSIFLASDWLSLSGFLSPAKADIFLSAAILEGYRDSIGTTSFFYSLIVIFSLSIGLISAFYLPRNLLFERFLSRIHL
jgi:anti-sigma factor RsiW